MRRSSRTAASSGSRAHPMVDRLRLAQQLGDLASVVAREVGAHPRAQVRGLAHVERRARRGPGTGRRRARAAARGEARACRPRVGPQPRAAPAGRRGRARRRRRPARAGRAAPRRSPARRRARGGRGSVGRRASAARGCRAAGSAPRRAPAGAPRRACRRDGWPGAGRPVRVERGVEERQVEAHVVARRSTASPRNSSRRGQHLVDRAAPAGPSPR